jgi:hypothetical protein
MQLMIRSLDQQNQREPAKRTPRGEMPNRTVA